MSEDKPIPAEGEVGIGIPQTAYLCPKHGLQPTCFASNLPALSGEWCIVCYLELVNRRCCRVRRVTISDSNGAPQ